MIYEFIYNGKSSRDFGILISERPNVYGAPAADVEAVSVPGRSGDLLFDNKRYENYEIEYQCAVMAAFDELPDKMRKIRNWLNADRGYNELRDTYTQGYFRKAAFMSAIEDSTTKKLCEFSVRFNCCPFMFADSGKSKIAVTAAKSTDTVTKIMTNPESLAARPIIHIKKYDIKAMSVTISGIDESEYYKVIEITGGGELNIDTENQYCYDGNGQQANSKISTADVELPSGRFTVTAASSGEYELSIEPRWRTL